MNVGVAILRLQEGLDCSQILADIDDLILNKFPKDKKQNYQSNEWSVASNSFVNFSTDGDTTVTSVTMCNSCRNVRENSFWVCLIFFFYGCTVSVNDESKVEETEESESPNDNEGRRTVVLGVTKSKKSKRSKKLAITYRYGMDAKVQ